jgi:DNA polymerase epsilon subunit 1
MQVEAYRGNVVCPNKHRDADECFYKGRLLASETYIGGKVEAIESGVFRADVPTSFSLQPEGYQYLIDRCRSVAYTIQCTQAVQ